jgi:multicomponent K+:H+ antiporter subunit G
MNAATDLPIWITALVILFLLTGSLLTVIGALGLFRLPNFMQRIHGPAITITLGAGSILIASMLLFSGLNSRPVIHELLITLFVFMTAPVAAMMMMRAAVYRNLREQNKES